MKREGQDRRSEQEKKSEAVGRLRLLIADWERSSTEKLSLNLSTMWGFNEHDLDYYDLKFVVESFAAGSQASYVARAQLVFDKMKASLDRQRVALTRLLEARMRVIEILDNADMSNELRQKIRRALG